MNRVLLENHVETCVMHAVEEGRTAQIVDELMETLRYTPAVTGPHRGDDMTETTLSVPEIHCDHCKMSIEGAVGALDGVSRGRSRRRRPHAWP